MARFTFFSIRTLLICCAFLTASAASMAEVIYSKPLKGKELPVGTLLEWATSLENNVQNFVVERSLDGIAFEDLGTVKASGFSKVDRLYRYMDIGASEPKTYYRLREVAADGTASFSAVSMVEKKMSNNFSIVSMANTEVARNLRLSLDCLVENTLAWSIIDMSDHLVDSGERALINGLNDLVLDFQTVPSGVYKVRLAMGDEVEELVVRRIEDAVSSKPNVASAKKSSSASRRN